MTAEQREQVNLIRWTQQAEVRAKYPELRLLYHVPNERKCTPQQGRTLKWMGVKSGVPDLCLPVPRGRWHGLYIEMKAPGRSAGASSNQRWWIGELNAQGYAACVCSGWERARDVLIGYMEGNDDGNRVRDDPRAH